MARLLAEMKAEIKACQERLKAEITAISDKLRSFEKYGPVRKELNQKYVFLSPG
jgi:hypothetical protein